MQQVHPREYSGARQLNVTMYKHTPNSVYEVKYKSNTKFSVSLKVVNWSQPIRGQVVHIESTSGVRGRQEMKF